MEVLDSKKWAKAYQAAGWKLVPIPYGQKGPVVSGWNKEERCHIEFWWTQNMGLAHAYSGTMALDIDNMDRTRVFFADQGLDIDHYLNDPESVHILSGKPGRDKLLYRLPAWLGPLPSRKIAEDNITLFEFRCATRDGMTVQDVLPPSIHPDTGQPYQWKGDYRNIPEIPPEILQMWLDINSELTPRHKRKNGAKPNATLIREALFSIDPDLDREQWVRVAMALHACDEDALWLFDQWSAGGSKYAGSNDTESVWNSIHSMESGIGPGTLFHIAKAHGWKSSKNQAYEAIVKSTHQSQSPGKAVQTGPLQLTDILDIFAKRYEARDLRSDTPPEDWAP